VRDEEKDLKKKNTQSKGKEMKKWYLRRSKALDVW
jgi:hypothetical protein